MDIKAKDLQQGDMVDTPNNRFLSVKKLETVNKDLVKAIFALGLEIEYKPNEEVTIYRHNYPTK